MPKKRPWNLWPQKFKEELNSVAGVTGFGGAAMSIAGMTIMAGTVGLVTSGAGAVITALTFAYAGYKAIPAKFINAESVVGISFNLRELSNIYPPIKKLAIVGPESAGKTTLKTNLAFEARTRQRTQLLSAQIVAIPDSPPKYLAVIDGAGEKFYQQFEIAKQADYICIVIDHNISDIDIKLSSDRIQQNTDFLDQVRNMLSEERLPRKNWIEILINKHDLWGNASTIQQAKFDDFCKSELVKWQGSNLADHVDMHPHSNERTGDVNKFMEVLKRSLKNN
ncbi:GTPase domain-containing protein [Mucilaginibacter sp. RCC_168]|uniref:GTPase domain-containing protein n=1 Tax=Mucilaginibacter sp. RCC_168 TaxID=3239221 RepID=UPI0035249C11